jgi:hypothetical protein
MLMNKILGKRSKSFNINVLEITLVCVSLVFPVFPRNARKERTNERTSKRSVVCVSRFPYYIGKRKKGNAEMVYI